MSALAQWLHVGKWQLGVIGQHCIPNLCSPPWRTRAHSSPCPLPPDESLACPGTGYLADALGCSCVLSCPCPFTPGLLWEDVWFYLKFSWLFPQRSVLGSQKGDELWGHPTFTDTVAEVRDCLAGWKLTSFSQGSLVRMSCACFLIILIPGSSSLARPILWHK